ncbi:MAG: gamma-glutamyltransferase [Nitrococcus sp.]|nr:gamma-glutamyltransferase [Nitrococcus sp.]
MPTIRLAVLVVFLLACSLAAAAGPGGAAVATAHPLATTAAVRILRAGGNAFDAAVAASAALAVVEPGSSGLGGGGFWLLYLADTQRTVMVDGRERAPLAAAGDMYLDKSGKPLPRASLDGALAAGIPGEPAALVHVAHKYGRLPLARSLAPAIRLAREGFPVSEEYVGKAKFRLQVLRRHRRAAAIYLDDGALPEPGWMLRQPRLAQTLETLGREGRAGFYAGPVAAEMVRAVRAAGGIWRLEDLRRYRVLEREPVVFGYRGYTVTAAAPPSAGGIGLATMLNILEGYDLETLDKATRVHLTVEAMRRAYRDRQRYLGDPDFVAIPRARLTSEAYAAKLRAGIELHQATPSAALSDAPAPVGADTTHFSIIDAKGNRVAATLSINYPFGAGVVAGKTGVLLNDEMDDFAKQPGLANVYGLVGGQANTIEPGKRPLSSMTPTFVEGHGRVAILGTPGGSRIITMVLLGILEFTEGEGPTAWVTRPRYHHQYLPDVIQHEPSALAGVRERLRAMGHALRDVGRRYGDMQAIMWDRASGRLEAASDPRGIGSARVVHLHATAKPGE